MSKKLNVVIIDDEPLAIDLLTSYVESNECLLLVAGFNDGAEGLRFIKNGNVDLVLLDIQMPDISGLDIASEIQGKCQVVFTTANAQHALQGFELDATDYLHKPFSLERFNLAISKVTRQAQLNDEQRQVVLKVDGSQKVVQCEDIFYVEAARKYVVFHTNQGTLICLMSMKEATEILDPHNFLRIHKSYIINPAYVDSYDRFEVTLQSQQLPLGDTYKKNLFNFFS